jgi:hypothetical protein
VALIALSLLGLTACDPDTSTEDTGTPDAGPTGDTPPGVDAGRDTPASSTTCSAVRTVTITAGTTTITGDTTGRPMDQTLSCAGFMASPQEAIQFTVPGSPGEMYGVDLNTAVGTTAFDTLIEVRPTCMDAANGYCQDDIDYPAEARTLMSVPVPGGTTLVAIVSGYGTDETGAWTMEITVRDINPPTLTAATATLEEVPGDEGPVLTLTADVTGGDVDGDGAGVLVEFLDATDEVIAFDLGDGAPTTEFSFAFDDSVAGMTTFTATSTVGGFEDLPEIVDAVSARFRIYDRTGENSAESIVAPFAERVGLGETCDGTETICNAGLVCEATVCALPAAVVTACAAATALTLDAAPSATEPSVTALTATIAVADGVLTAPCQPNTPSTEALYTFTVPAGSFDLLVTTAGTTTGETDTVVYLMSTCGDTSASPEEYCADDVTAKTDLSSALEVRDIAPGTYTVAFEIYDALDAETDVDGTVTLRPVLDAGAACDPAGVNNRCSTGACPSSMVCPAAP